MKEQCRDAIREAEVEIPMWERPLRGAWARPAEDCRAIVVVTNTSEAGRFSPRSRYLSRAFREAGMGTLLVDLLDDREARDRNRVFDVAMLAARVEAATGWLVLQPENLGIPIGYYGASTGAAAAMVAAARHPREVGAVAVRGGRLDLAWDYLPEIRVPTLLIVGGHDEVVLDLNEWALDRMRCPKELVIVPEATHFFPEPGALETVARLAVEWFRRYLLGTHSDSAGSSELDQAGVASAST